MYNMMTGERDKNQDTFLLPYELFAQNTSVTS